MCCIKFHSDWILTRQDSIKRTKKKKWNKKNNLINNVEHKHKLKTKYSLDLELALLVLNSLVFMITENHSHTLWLILLSYLTPDKFLNSRYPENSQEVVAIKPRSLDPETTRPPSQSYMTTSK